MKKAFMASAIVLIAVFSLYSIRLIYKTHALKKADEIVVLLVQNPFLSADSPHILKAYKSVLDEEGVPYQAVSDSTLLNFDADELLHKVPAIIFPDGIAQTLPGELNDLMEEYLRLGGNVAVIYDAGTRNKKGAFLKEAVFTEITGINYITYDRSLEKAYETGYIKASEQNMNFLQIPYGKTYETTLIGGYTYGMLKYPIARNEVRSSLRKGEVFAIAVTDEGETFPAVVLRDHGKGNIMYVNLPLGHLKAFSDDLPLRVLIRTFLFKNSKTPHLLNTYYGRGGLAINWHIDANVDWKSIPIMVKKGYLRKDIQYSFHISAGEFRDRPNDGLGFDACGKGRQNVQTLLNFGVIGSHGGWAHNWFSTNVLKENFRKKEIYDYIKKNNDCLESITGYKVEEYAAPNGVHPQPVTTDVLGELGITTYYYTGDAGSVLNRTFLNGEMISETVLAFPIMPFGKSASLFDMSRAGKTEEEVERWFMETTDYVLRNRTVRLIYSHPYDIPRYPDAFRRFLDYAGALQGSGRLDVKPMGYFARFMLRFLKTKFSFTKEKDGLLVTLENPEGLEGVTVAIPKDICEQSDVKDVIMQKDEDYCYISLVKNDLKKTFSVGILHN